MNSSVTIPQWRDLNQNQAAWNNAGIENFNEKERLKHEFTQYLEQVSKKVTTLTNTPKNKWSADYKSVNELQPEAQKLHKEMINSIYVFSFKIWWLLWGNEQEDLYDIIYLLALDADYLYKEMLAGSSACKKLFSK